MSPPDDKTSPASAASPFQEGSVWWSIRPSIESASYDDRDATCPPALVKLWKNGMGAWWASAFNEQTGEVDNDTNATRCQEPTDVGRTLFRTEEEAWRAHLGEAPTPGTLAEELDARAERVRLAGQGRGSSVAAAHVEALRRLAAQVRGLADAPGSGCSSPRCG